MKTNFLKGSFYALLLTTLATGNVSCGDDDDPYENVTVPEVAATYRIGGMVTAINGDAIASATVTLKGAESLTVTTDAKGVYTFEGVKAAGTYQLEAKAEGKVTDSGSVTLDNNGKSQVGSWNARLAAAPQEVTVKADAPTEVAMTTETKKGNEAAATTVEATVPAGALPAGAKISLGAAYGEGAGTKAKVTLNIDQLKLVITNAAGQAIKATEAFKLKVTTKVAAAKKVKVTTASGTTESTAPAAAFEVEVIESATILVSADADHITANKSEALAFSKKEVDNLYGSKNLTETVSYTYKVGAEVVSGTGKALEILIAKMGASTMQTLSADYVKNFEIPVGTKFTFSGNQAYQEHTVTFDGQKAVGKVYGKVAPTHSAENRKHSGGSN